MKPFANFHEIHSQYSNRYYNQDLNIKEIKSNLHSEIFESPLSTIYKNIYYPKYILWSLSTTNNFERYQFSRLLNSASLLLHTAYRIPTSMATSSLLRFKNAFSISLKIPSELFNFHVWLNSHRQSCLPRMAHFITSSIHLIQVWHA